MKLIKCICWAFIALAMPSVAWAETDVALLDAIRQVESGGVCLQGDGGLARGPYQIHRGYWLDGCRFLGVDWDYQSGSMDENKSRQIVKAYLNHYGENKSVEQKARIHNGGPNGHKKQATLKYWQKVKAEMERQGK